MNKENIAILVGRYIPKPSPNGICIDSIINKIDKRKYNVTVFCYEDFLTASKEGIKVIKIKRDLINSSLYKRQNANKESRLLNFLSKIKDVILLPVWPLNEPFFARKLFKKLETENEINSFKYLICVYVPLCNLIVGHKFKKKHPSVNYIAYLLDSFVGGHFPRFLPKKYLFWRRRKWQNKVLSNCDKIVAMNSSKNFEIQYNKNKNFFKKYIFLDIPLLEHKNNANLKRIDKSNNIVVTFSGNAQFPYRNIEFFFEIIKRISNPRIKFLFIGDTNYEPLKKETVSNIKYLPFLPHEQLDKYLRNSDIFLNLGVKNASTISGKIFEYASYGKPIISTFSIDNESCINYLKKYPKHLLIDERIDNFDHQAENVEQFILNNYNFTIPFSEISSIYQDSLPETFIEKCLK